MVLLGPLSAHITWPLKIKGFFFSASICCLLVDMFLYRHSFPQISVPESGTSVTSSEGRVWNTYESQKCEEYISDDADAVTAV